MNGTTNNGASRRVKRIIAEQRRRRIVEKRRAAVAMMALLAAGAVVSMIGMATGAKEAEEAGSDEGGVIYFTDRPQLGVPIGGATAEMWRIQEDARRWAEEKTETIMAKMADEKPEIVMMVLTEYILPEEYEDGYFPLDFQWYLADVLANLGIPDEYPVAVAMYETESGYNPEAMGENGDKGGFQVVEGCNRERMERLGVDDLYDIYDNAAVAMDLYAELLKEYDGDRIKALTAYNGGRGAVTGGASTEYAEKVLEKAERIECDMELAGKRHVRFRLAEDGI